MLAAKRLLQRASVFAALVGVAAIVTGLAVGLTGYVAEAEDAGARLELGSRTGSAAALDTSLDLTEDATAQDAAMRRVLSTIFTNNGSPIAMEVSRSTVTESLVDFTKDGGAEQRAQFASIPDLESAATIVDGDWAASPTEVTVQADAAGILELAPGDVIDVDGRELVVAGTWRVDDEVDPRWFFNTLITAGSSEAFIGPIVTDEPTLVAVGGTVRAHWTIVPDAESISASDLASTVGGWQQLSRTVRTEDALDTSSLDFTGGLARTATEFEARANALRAVEPVALLTVAAVAVITVVELARLLTGLRSAETVLLWSRGSRSRRLVIASILEAALVGLLGAGIGLAIALSVSRYSTMAVIAPIAMVLLIVTAIGVSTATSIRSLARNELPGDSDRAQRIGGLGLVALIVLSAGLAVWQLLRYGTPISSSPSGRPQVDPLAVLAPSLALVGLVLVAALAIPVLARAAERRAAASPGYPRVLAARTLARRRSTALTPFVLCALAFGQLVIAAGYAQTWGDSYETAQQLRTGSAVRVTAGPRVLTEPLLDRIASAEHVDGIANLRNYAVSISALSGQLVAVAPAAIEALASAPGLDAAQLADAISMDPPGPTLPAGAAELRVEVTTIGLDEPPAATVLLTSPWGATHSLDLVPDATGYTAELPASRDADAEGWRITAIDFALPPLDAVPVDEQQEPPRQSLTITGVTTDDAPVDLGDGWTALALTPQPFELGAPSGVGFTSAGEADGVRLVPPYVSGEDAAPVLEAPIVISASLAATTGLENGDVFRIAVDPRIAEVQVRVVDVVPAIPGSAEDEALLIDASIVQAVLLRAYAQPPTPSQVWVGTAEPVEASVAIGDLLPAGTRVDSISTDSARAVLASASVALWIGAAGTGLLALTALGAVVGGQLRSRLSEVVVLRALGVAARSQARMRKGELLAVLGAGATAGLLAGAIVTLLVISPLARAAVPQAYESLGTPIAIAAIPLSAAVAAIAALLLLATTAYGSVVHRQARRASSREEAL